MKNNFNNIIKKEITGFNITGAKYFIEIICYITISLLKMKMKMKMK
jgi:hypothetical protein